MICESPELSRLDRKMAEVFTAALETLDVAPRTLSAAQRGWIKGRDACSLSERAPVCVRDAYLRRIAELQARYGLVPYSAPVIYSCKDDKEPLVVTFFETQPPTLLARRADQETLMFLQPAASGSRYAGTNEVFWEHGGEATVRWGFDKEEMRCFSRA